MTTPLSPPPGAADKLRYIRSITDAALSHLGAEDPLIELLSRAKQILDADTAAVQCGKPAPIPASSPGAA